MNVLEYVDVKTLPSMALSMKDKFPKIACVYLVSARSLILCNPNKLTIWEARHRAIATGKQQRLSIAVGFRATQGAFNI